MPCRILSPRPSAPPWTPDNRASRLLPPAIIGPLIIHPFRDHHDHSDAIARYRFLEQDSTNYMIIVPPLLFAWWRGGPHNVVELLAYGALLGFSVGALGTNLFHKWAHAQRIPPGVRWLQRWGLILSPKAHARHHNSYTHGYCVTSGWMNRILDPLDFFGRAERLIRWILRRPRPIDAQGTQ